MAAVQLQALSHPDRFIRHQNFFAELSRPVVGRAGDFSWVLMKRGGKRVGIRSVNFKKRYLRHKHFRLVLEEPNGPRDDLWEKDSTFEVVQGLADPTAISFRAINLPGEHYIRHRDFHLFVEPRNDLTFARDATFSKMVAID